MDHRFGFAKEIVWGLKIIRLGVFQGFLVEDNQPTMVAWHQVKAQRLTAHQPDVVVEGEEARDLLPEQPPWLLLVTVRTMATP